MNWFIPVLIFFVVLVVFDMFRNAAAKARIEQEYIQRGYEYKEEERDYMLYKMTEHNNSVTTSWVVIVFLMVVTVMRYM